jgi:type IV pilus biogenesis protein CpaD/CtpE
MQDPPGSPVKAAWLALLAFAFLAGCSDARRHNDTPNVAALSAPPPRLALRSLVLVPVGQPPRLTAADHERIRPFAVRFLDEGTGRIRIDGLPAGASALRAELAGALLRAGIDADRLAFAAPPGQPRPPRAVLTFHALDDTGPGCGPGGPGLSPDPGPEDAAFTLDELSALGCLRQSAFLRQLDDAADLLRERRETQRDPRRRLNALQGQPAETAPPAPARPAPAGTGSPGAE